MSQLSFKFPEKEINFLKWYSEQTAEPLGTIYRKVTIDHFKKWKIDVLMNAYMEGKIGVKQIANLGGLTYLETMLLLEKREIEPPYNELLAKHSEQVLEKEIEKIKGKK